MQEHLTSSVSERVCEQEVVETSVIPRRILILSEMLLTQMVSECKHTFNEWKMHRDCNCQCEQWKQGTTRIRSGEIYIDNDSKLAVVHSIFIGVGEKEEF